MQKRGGGSTMSFLDELRDLIAPHGSNATATALALGTASKALVGGAKKRGRPAKRSKTPAKKRTVKKTVAKRSKSPVKKSTVKKTVAKRSKSPIKKRSKTPVKRSKTPVKKRVVKKRTVKKQRGGDLLRELVAPHGLGATAAAAALVGLNHLKGKKRTTKKTKKPVKKRASSRR